MGNTKIYVGNLSYNIDEQELKKVFEGVGEVQSVKIIKDPGTGRSKGFAFVEMSSGEEAQKAIATLNGSTLMERTITVNEARPQVDRGRSGGFGGRKSFDKGKRGSSSGGGRNSGNWR